MCAAYKKLAESVVSMERDRNVQVVVVDVHPIVRAGVRWLLEEAPGVALAGETATEHQALRLVRDLKPHVLILGMNLPEEKSLDLARRLFEAESSTQVLAFGAREEGEHLYRVLACGVAGYLMKEDETGLLVEAVRGVGRGESGWLSPRLTAKLVAPAKAKQPLPGEVLTRREREILELIAQGNANDLIAETLFISADTVKNHITKIYSKLGTHSRAEAVAWAWRHGIVQEDHFSN